MDISAIKESSAESAADFDRTKELKAFHDSKSEVEGLVDAGIQQITTDGVQVDAEMELYYDRQSELKAFDDTKTGVKGLVDAGITKVPRIFHHNQIGKDESDDSKDIKFDIPIIDFTGVDEDPNLRKEIIYKVRDALKSWGYFQVINHGIRSSVIDDMIEGVRRFHEQDAETKKEFYSRDFTKKFIYNSNFDLYKATATNWRDTVYCVIVPHPPEPHEMSQVCREILMEYSKHVMKLGHTLFELLSEALGLKPSELSDMDCGKGLFFLGHYYPSCPEPESTFATSSHTDIGFLTVLIQDQVGGLQVLYENQWVDVPPVHGSVVVNIGDLLQLIANDRFQSVHHRVLAKKEGPSISVAGIFRTHFLDTDESKVYEPAKKQENPPIYRGVTINEFITHYNNKGLDGTSSLSYFKLQK